MAESKKSTFEMLNAVDVSEHKEDKPTANGKSLSYLSWAWAWAEVKKRCPDANYEIIKYDGIPYIYDEKTGYMVYTKVTIEGITHEMWLPVMDSNNCAMKAEPYEIQTKYKTITIKPATMFDINKTIMRCLTKNLAMFGLGLYIYAGEDLPEELMATETAPEAPQPPKKPSKASSPKPAQKAPEKAAPAPQEEEEAKLPFDIPTEMNQTLCSVCGLPIESYDKYSAETIIRDTINKIGNPVCFPCLLQRKAKKAEGGNK